MNNQIKNNNIEGQGVSKGNKFPESPAALFTAIILVPLLISGCGAPDRYVKPQIREQLRTASTFDVEKVIKEPAKRLQDVPLTQKEEIFNEAKSAVTPPPKMPVISMSLSDARRHSLENNLSLKVDSYTPSISEQGYLAEKAKFEAVIGATVGFNEENDFMGDPTQTVSALPFLEIPTKEGGTVKISIPYSKTSSDSIDPVTLSPAGTTITTGLDLSFSQPFLRGGGRRAAYASIEIAGLQLHQADSRMKLSAIRLLANVEKAYWLYYAAYEDLKIQVRKYELAMDHVKMAKRLVEEGVRTKIEVTRAESGVARQFESIIRAENLRRQSERSLKRLINLPDLQLESKTIIQPVTSPHIEGLIFDREKVIELAYKNRMELFENELQQAIDRISVDVNKNAALPDLIFNFTYSASGSAPELNDSIDRILKDELNTYAVGMTAQLPIYGNKSAKARLKGSILSQKQTLAARKDLETAIKQEVLNAIDGLEQDWQRILSTHLAIALANDSYEGEKTQFMHGLNTSTDVLQALTDLSEAESAHINAIRDYQNSLTDLAFATGTILGKSDIIWTPEGLGDMP